VYFCGKILFGVDSTVKKKYTNINYYFIFAADLVKEEIEKDDGKMKNYNRNKYDKKNPLSH